MLGSMRSAAAVTKMFTIAAGRRIFQQSFWIWSKRNRGRSQRTVSCSHIITTIFPMKAPAPTAANQNGVRFARSHPSKKMGCQPPRNTAVRMPASTTISANSARNSRPNFMPEYSMK